MAMKPQSFIFIGRSGCGKGTQVELLIKALKEKDTERGTLYIQTGHEFRKFIAGSSVTQEKSRHVYEHGGLQPEFLTVHMWVNPLVEYYNGKDYLIFDGTPRKHHEAGVLHSIFEFYGFEKPTVIYINISPEEALKRLLKRKRMDDVEEEIKKRLSWYESDVVPTLDYYRHNPAYTFLEIDGERSVEEIRGEIAGKIGLKN